MVWKELFNTRAHEKYARLSDQGNLYWDRDLHTKELLVINNA